jgi:hypothetical protein
MRFCTSCQATRDEEGGVYRQVNKTARWICVACLQKKSLSIYRNLSGKPTPVNQISKLVKKLREHHGQT